MIAGHDDNRGHSFSRLGEPRVDAVDERVLHAASKEDVAAVHDGIHVGAFGEGKCVFCIREEIFATAPPLNPRAKAEIKTEMGVGQKGEAHRASRTCWKC